MLLLMKQNFFVTHRYTVLQQTGNIWRILSRPTLKRVVFWRMYKDEQLFFVNATFWQKVCFYPDSLVCGNFSIKNCVGYDKLPYIDQNLWEPVTVASPACYFSTKQGYQLYRFVVSYVTNIVVSSRICSSNAETTTLYTMSESTGSDKVYCSNKVMSITLYMGESSVLLGRCHRLVE